MEFKILPVKKKQPLKAMKKGIAIVAVSLVVIAVVDDFLLDLTITKKLNSFREHQAKKYAVKEREYAEKLKRRYINN